MDIAKFVSACESMKIPFDDLQMAMEAVKSEDLNIKIYGCDSEEEVKVRNVIPRMVRKCFQKISDKKGFTLDEFQKHIEVITVKKKEHDEKVQDKFGEYWYQIKIFYENNQHGGKEEWSQILDDDLKSIDETPIKLKDNDHKMLND